MSKRRTHSDPRGPMEKKEKKMGGITLPLNNRSLVFN
jgi:hypothetical protein